ncbi:sulfurtransferase [Egibacter rhizosphaerae]|uniref:Sulfurtransferase n=1 Tax=Egibacter rhizosphaerae TaxID=1670831 RepID=A0A411YLT4_9ACTN|nr:sulfurtransferase [Egibacter rhizosphaerae]
MPTPLVDAAWLAAHRDEVHVVDCQYVLGEPGEGRRRYLAGHIPKAAFLSLEEDLSAPEGPGRNPLPSIDAFVESARRAGIGDDRPVVAYDQAMVGSAARLWWLLRHVGKEDVAVLDGGLEGWDVPLASGEEPVERGDLVARPRRDDLVDRDDVAARLGEPGRVLLDSRAPARFRGEHEPMDPVAGHIPGARNVPLDEALPADVADPDTEIVAYCGSGVSACALLVRLAAAGRDDAKLYAGSWSDWSAHDLPVATGEDT